MLVPVFRFRKSGRRQHHRGRRDALRRKPSRRPTANQTPIASMATLLNLIKHPAPPQIMFSTRGFAFTSRIALRISTSCSILPLLLFLFNVNSDRTDLLQSKKHPHQRIFAIYVVLRIVARRFWAASRHFVSSLSARLVHFFPTCTTSSCTRVQYNTILLHRFVEQRTME